jgi:hypothetical protein
MPFQAVPDGIKIELNAIQNGVPIVNVLHVESAVPITPTVLEDVATEVFVWYGLNDALFHPSYILQNITTTDISVANGQQYIASITSGGAGTASGAAAAANAAAVASLRTAYTGRSFRGRIYFGGMGAAAFADAQNISSGAATAYATAVGDLITALQAIGQTLSVLSRYSNLVLRVTGLLTEVISVIVDTKVDSQRRRTAN